MATSIKSLTRDWIQYLKNNKIVSLQSDPKSGRLNYQRQPTAADLIEFLLVKTEWTEREIKTALKTVRGITGDGNSGTSLAVPDQGNSSSERGVSDWMYYGMSPGKRPEYDTDSEFSNGQQRLGHEPPKLGKDASTSPAKKSLSMLKHDPDSISDVDFREVPSAPESPRGLPAPASKKKTRSRGINPKISEDFRDDPGDELSEKDIAAVFKELLSVSAADAEKEKQAAADAEKEKQEKETPSSAEMQAKKEEDLRKMKRLIRDVMTDSQRKSLWRMLNE